MGQSNSFLYEIRPSQIYKPVDDLWVITTFFNSQNYVTKHNNFNLFIDSLEKSCIKYLVIECAFNDQPFILPNSPNILKVRSKSVLWQKERLLNVAIQALPKNCTKLAWIDCDILFENESWIVETSKLLDTYPVVQPFEFVIRLPKGCSYYEGKGDQWESFASVYQKRSNQLPACDFNSHGHTGFAWAIRKEIITKNGLYDASISGSGDHIMAHAFCGDYYSDCMTQIFGQNDFAIKHFYEWAQAIYQEISGKIGFIPGTILHLWHGDIINRQYLKRNQELAQFKFNPYEDIFINSEGCWEWNDKDSSKYNLHQWAIQYYYNRKEDG
ncbi:hypothetical protein [Xanthocytophaga flava]|uniref:hypothetical protein n=1 Tax=Xanthocytophaga flava TaxID=3048013 RepID=UPI0028D6C8E4|nr:hypothetical protein [Xanthocytophaga flavus]MDJ1473227.1 hypothetical protein [Xanthocytophaga flavus]